MPKISATTTEPSKTKIKLSEDFMRKIRSISPEYCDKCGTKHTVGDLEVVRSDSINATCRLHCTGCGNDYMIHASAPMEGLVTGKRGAFNTDVNSRELSKFSKASQIHTDEVIDIFSQIKDIDSIDEFNKLVN